MKSSSQKIVFFGTPEFACPSLQAILDSRRQVIQVVTQPDKPAGRGKKISAPPVKTFAQEHQLPFLQPKSIRTPKFLERIRELAPDIIVVVAYGKIFPLDLLQIPQITLNVHASLLPRWRGAAPITRAIESGDAHTGVSIMKLVEELDAGDYCIQKSTPIEDDDTTESLTPRLAELGAQALVEALNQLESGEIKFFSQDPKQVTYAKPLMREEGQIDWNQTSANLVHKNQAFSPWPGTYTFDGQQQIKILKMRVSSPEDATKEEVGSLHYGKRQLWVKTQDAWVEVLELQAAGKKALPTAQFLAGYRAKKIGKWKSICHKS